MRWCATSPTASPSPTSAWPARAPSALVLVAANLAPLIGVLFWDWKVLPLIVLFWMENLAIGVLNIARILCAEGTPAPARKGHYAASFAFRYGLFCAAHGAFIFSVFGVGAYSMSMDDFDILTPALRAATDLGLWLPFAALAASHAFSFGWNYLRAGEFRRTTPAELVHKPFGRVLVLHLGLLLGGFTAAALEEPLWALVALVALKIGLDLRAHAKEHSKA